MRPSVTLGTSPFRMWRSVPQIVEVVIRTTASVASWIVGLGRFSQARLPGPVIDERFHRPPDGRVAGLEYPFRSILHRDLLLVVR